MSLIMLQQLGRFWEKASYAAAAPLRFVEADEIAPGNLYACPLPPGLGKLLPAASLTALSSPPNEPWSPLRNCGVLVETAAGSRSAALGLLEDLRKLLRPGAQPLVHVGAAHAGGFSLDGVLGPPPPHAFPPAGLEVYRIRRADIVAEAQLVGFAGDGEQLHRGRMTIQLQGSAAIMPPPLVGFSLQHDGAGDVTSASVQVDRAGLQMLLRAGAAGGPLITAGIDLAAVGDLGQLQTAIAGLSGQHAGWQSSVIDAQQLLRSAADLAGHHELAALSAARPVAVYA